MVSFDVSRGIVIAVSLSNRVGDAIPYTLRVEGMSRVVVLNNDRNSEACELRSC
jgi:hypothetical protein